MSEPSETAVHSELDGRSATTKPTTRRTLLHGLVGVVLAFLPYSTVLGGAVAGSLESGDYVSGAKVGTVAGGVPLVPVTLVVLSVLYLPVEVSLPVPFDVSLTPVVVLGVAYVVGLSLLGGVLGAFVRAELSE